MTIRVVTFDLDNTLWDVEPALLRAEAAQRRWLTEHRPGAIDDIDGAALWEHKKSLLRAQPRLIHHVSDMRRELLYELQRNAGFSDADARSGAETAFREFLAERHRVELYEEALAVIEQLAASYRIGALTNGNADIYKTDAGDYFDFAFLAEDIGASKPAPDMFHAAIKVAGIPPSQIAHVGDSPEHDIEGAHSAGLRTVWFNPGGAPWPADKACTPDKIVTSLTELPTAIGELNQRSAPKP